MSQSSANADPQTDAFSLWPAGSALLFLTLAFGGSEAISQWNNIDGKEHFNSAALDIVLIILAIVFLVVELAIVAVLMVKRRWTRTVAHLAAIFLIVGAFAAGQTVFLLMQRVKLLVLSPMYDSCASRAVPYDPDHKFRVCSIRSDGNNHTMIIFDSGGQIDRDEENQDKLFKEMIVNSQSYIINDCRLYVRHMSGYFYFVQAIC